MTLLSFAELIELTVAVLRDSVHWISATELTASVRARLALPGNVGTTAHDDPQELALSNRVEQALAYIELAGVTERSRQGSWRLKASAPSGIAGAALVAQVRAAHHAAATPEHRDSFEGYATSAELELRIADELRRVHADLLAKGKVKRPEEMLAYYARFRERFGPRVLEQLDGERLLETMHGRGTKDSLVYWLEFKEDDELPDLFGGIGGGSALKFEIYKASDTGAWMAGTATSKKALSTAEAVDFARQQRDTLVGLAAILEEVSRSYAPIDFDALHERLAAPRGGFALLGWVHKTLSMYFPDLIDPFHALPYQRFRLLKLGKAASRNAIYANARFFVGIAKQLDVPLVSLAKVLDERDGHTTNSYWRIGTTAGSGGADEWPRMRDGGFVGVGWEALPSLADFKGTKEQREKLRALIQHHYPNPANVVGRATADVGAFVAKVVPGDIVVAMKGATNVLGVGRVTGPYMHVPNDGPFPHRHPVEWLDVEPWKLFEPEGMLTTIYRFDKHEPKSPLNLVAIEHHAALPLPSPTSAVVGPGPGEGADGGNASVPPLAPLSGIVGRVERTLQRKGQAILYGPPGTGKTFWALKVARAMVARSWHGVDWETLSEAQVAAIREGGGTETCCFHPSYGYEDFLEGLRPKNQSGQLLFEPRDGVFKKMCKRATAAPNRTFVLVVDEINRGDTPRIFGELLLALEKDKRGTPVTLPLTGEVIVVPPNLFLLGTMNTADRSIALLDAALRRRFGFVELMPNIDVFGASLVGGLPLGPWLEELNRRVQKHMKRDARNLQIGHSYLMHEGEPVTDPARFAEVLRDDVIPLLEEYYYDDFDALEQVLGKAVVRREDRRINEALFNVGASGQLLDALKKAFPEVYTSSVAVSEPADETSDDEADAAGEEATDGA